MDTRRFDDLTRALVTGSSRRRVLRGLTGGALGGVFGLLGLEEAAAACRLVGQRCDNAHRCCSGAKCTARGRCTCRAGLSNCSGRCFDLRTNMDHCGGCNTPCPSGTSCVSGQCICPDTRSPCGTHCCPDKYTCVDPETETCSAGTCPSDTQCRTDSNLWIPCGKESSEHPCYCGREAGANGSRGSAVCLEGVFFCSDIPQCGYDFSPGCAEGEVCVHVRDCCGSYNYFGISVPRTVCQKPCPNP